MYAKVFRALWDGTLADSWEAWALFVFLLAHADAEGYVDMTPQAIARRSSLPIEAVRRGLEVLEAPDPESRSEAEAGRRLVRIDDRRPWGWRIVNARYYRGLTDAETVREAARVRQADRRRRLRDEPVEHQPGCPWSAALPEILYVGCPGCHDLSDRHGLSRGVTESHARSRQAEAEEEAEESTPTSLRSVGAAEPLPGTGSNVPVLGPEPPACGLEPDGAASGLPGTEPGPHGAPVDFRAVREAMIRRGLAIPPAGGKPEWTPTEAMLAEWRAAFPGVDVEAQIRAMRTWSLTHLSQRKTLRGMPAFVNRWLSTEQDKTGRSAPGRPGQARSHRGPTDARYLDHNRRVISGEGGRDA